MKGKRLILLVAVILGLLAAPTPSPAENDPWQGPPGEEDLANIRKKIETLRAWRLSEELDLDEKSRAKLFAAMKDADEEGWRIEALNWEMMRELKGELEERQPDPRRIEALLDRLQENRMEKARAESRHLARVREILSPEDTARYLMFQVAFQRELRDRAVRAFREGEEGGKHESDSGSRRDRGGDGGSSGGDGKKK